MPCQVAARRHRPDGQRRRRRDRVFGMAFVPISGVIACFAGETNATDLVAWSNAFDDKDGVSGMTTRPLFVERTTPDVVLQSSARGVTMVSPCCPFALQSALFVLEVDRASGCA